jgi:hypothetical protein
MTIYLYVKTHNKTGLKYLGKTTNSNLHSYTGSGKYWRNHLKKHGRDFTTEILKECDTNDEVKEWGLYYSQLWDVVKSNEWANLTEETGTGGKTVENFRHSDESKALISATHKGKKKSPAHIEKMRKNSTGKSWGCHTEETKEKCRSYRHTEEFKEKMSKERLGENNPNFGKTTSEEAKAKIREGVKKSWEERRLRAKERAEALSN